MLIMENTKAGIQGILLNSSQKSAIGWAVEEDDFEAVAEEIVKKYLKYLYKDKTLRKEIREILLNNSQKSAIGWAVEEDDFEAVAEEIVKKYLYKDKTLRKEMREMIDEVESFIQFVNENANNIT